MTPFVQHPAASLEYQEAVRYYAAIHPDLAVDFDAAVIDHRNRICADPHLFRVRKLNIRRVNLAPQFKAWFVAYMPWHSFTLKIGRDTPKRQAVSRALLRGDR